MKKRLLSLMLSLVVGIASVVSFSAVSVSAATEVVPVYLNEKAITFPANDAQPQIISNRTYVPIRATCDALGLEIDWNSKTETLTFTREGVVISHTMRSKIVYVNGEALNFDTPSINVNNRTLMPIRMLGESIGATVDWDNTTRSVHITTAGSTTSDVKIESLTSSATAVANGDKVVLTATANANTGKVKFVDASTGDVISEVSGYLTAEDGSRVFTADLDCKNSTSDQLELNIKAIPGADNGEYVESADVIKSVSIIVAVDENDAKDDEDEEDDENTSTDVDDFESDYFVELTYDSKVVDGYCRFTATTEDNVSRVKAAIGDEETIIKDYDEDDDYRIFEGKIKVSDSGSQKLKIDLYADGEYEDINETFKVEVESSSSNSSKSGDGEIIDVEVVNDTFYASMPSPIYVTTSTDIDYVEITDDTNDDRVVGKTSFTTSKTKTEKVWTLDVTTTEVGSNRYTVTAYSDDKAVDDYSVNLRTKKYSKSVPAVLSMEQKSSYIKAGSEAKFSARVTGCVTEIEIRKESGGSVLGTATSSSSSTSTKNITVSFEVSNDSEAYYTAYAYDGSGDSSTYTFKIAGETYGEIKINDVDYDDSEKYEFGDPIDITVYTSNSCERLWVEDSRGTKASRTYTTPDDEDGSEYIWHVTFSTVNDDETKKTKSFTIMAEDDEKETDEEYITVRFK